jgi:hypothetical protein
MKKQKIPLESASSSVQCFSKEKVNFQCSEKKLIQHLFRLKGEFLSFAPVKKFSNSTLPFLCMQISKCRRHG